jgi:hypothetical protein
MDINSTYQRMKGRQEQLTQRKKALIKKQKENELQSERLEKVRTIITEVTALTQSQFKERVETLVTTAIEAVYDRRIEFQLKFEQRSNRLQCIPTIIEGQNKNEHEVDYDIGGGLLDLVSFAFRIVLWSLQPKPSRPTFILDEPLRFLGESKAETLERAAGILKELSHKLGCQLIVVTHQDAISELADKSFHIEHNGTHSIITCEEQDLSEP